MAVSARSDAPAPDPGGEVRPPDPRSPGWADVRKALIIQAQAVGLAIADLAERPGSEAALDMARLNLGVLEHLGEIGRRWVLDESILAVERTLAYDQGVADCKAARCRLEVIEGGRAS